MAIRILTFTLFLFLNFESQLKNQHQELTIEQRFTEWIENINKKEKVDSSIIGFNFGLFESTEGFEMYLIGSKTFDIHNEDWATNIDFEPNQKYFRFGQDFSKGKGWQEIVEYAEKLVSDFVNSEDFESSILANAIGITTGFDDGNLTVIYAK